MDKISVYDNEGLRIGGTYPRRAKQLVIKQKAVWQDAENKGIRLVDTLDSASYEEDKQMELDNTIEVKEEAVSEVAEAREETSTSVPVEEKPGDSLSNDLLMYIAKQNVKMRYNLFLNIVLFPVVLIALAIITDGFNTRGMFSGSFYAGIFFSWGCLILYKCYLAIRAWSASKPRLQKEDLVKAEYERLKKASSDKIGM